MTLIVAFAAAALFAVALRRSNLIGLSRRVIVETAGTMRVLGDRSLDDDAKERAARGAAAAMLRLFGNMLARTVVVLLAPAVLIAAGVAAGVTDMDSIWRTGLSWPFLLGSTLLLGLLMLPRRA